MSGWLTILKQLVTGETEQERLCYVPYRDSGGNDLKPEEILFTDHKGYTGKQTLEVWGREATAGKTYTVYSPDVELIFSDAGNFPIALKTKEGKLCYLKISKKTGEVLPIHAGCCPVLSIIYIGPPAAAKTVNILQVSDPAFHDMIARETACSIEDDLPSEAPRRRKYEDARAALKKHILPEPNKFNEIILPYIYYLQFDEDGKEKRMLLKLEDIDGQQCTEMAWDSKIFQSNYYILTIGADEIIAGEKGGVVWYPRVVDQFLPRLRVLRRDQDYEILVMITKSDCLDKENPHLKTAFANSIAYNDGKWKQLVHEKGFNYEVFEHRSQCVENYIKDECPNFYNKLVNAVPKDNITFCMIANVGEACENNQFQTLQPFCVDEPILSILTKAGMYPVSVEGEESKVVDAGSFTFPKASNFWKQVLEKIDLEELEEDEDIFNDEY